MGTGASTNALGRLHVHRGFDGQPAGKVAGFRVGVSPSGDELARYAAGEPLHNVVGAQGY
jgi:hypothetical protein